MKQSLLVIGLVFSLGLNAGLLLRNWHPYPISEPSPRNTAGSTDGSGRMPQAQARDGGTIGPAQMAERLGLEGEQRRQFRQIKSRYFRRTAEKRREVRELQAELRRLLSEPEADRSQTEPLLAQLTSAHGELETLFVDHFLATRDLLDTEQKALYQELLMSQLDRRGRRFAP